MSDINITFCRRLLIEAHKAVKVAFPNLNLRNDAWVYRYSLNRWEFHGPDKFYWYGRATNAYDARYKGWMAYLRHTGMEVA